MSQPEKSQVAPSSDFLPPRTKGSQLHLRLLVAITTAVCFLNSVPAAMADTQKAIDVSTLLPVKNDAPGWEKLDMNLKVLANQYGTVRGVGTKGLRFSTIQLKNLFGIESGEKNPKLEVAITTSAGTSSELLKKDGAQIRFQLADTFYATVPTSALLSLAKESEVRKISLFSAVQLPTPPELPSPLVKPAVSSRGKKEISAIDRKGRSGKNVIVSVIDSGIDWRHPDFIRPDGTSRILYLYDLFDTSWKDSGGTIGTRPPEYLDSDDGVPTGTVYTNEQLSRALIFHKIGYGSPETINSEDEIGHGTACAGMAAGNGRAGTGIKSGTFLATYPGVAPEADLIVVKGMRGTIQNQEFHPLVTISTKWVVDKAEELKRPCAINLSWRTQQGAHDGGSAIDEFISSLCSKEHPGIVICAAAGNDRRQHFHASGRFGPTRKGQLDSSGNILGFVATQDKSLLECYFEPNDNWQLQVKGPGLVFQDKETGETSSLLIVTKQDPADPDQAPKADGAVNIHWNSNEYRLQLPKGRYALQVNGIDSKVSGGSYDLYSPAPGAIVFDGGGDKRCLVGSPGTATNAITVGAYDDLTEWTNLSGETAYCNLTNGEISSYSNAGYRRDGVIKPEIAAPGTYAVSSLAHLHDGKPCQMGQDPVKVTQDTFHVAWTGTSVATPYVTGLTALILEKDSKLNCHQVKQILCKTAKTDAATSGVPNRDFGYGKADPAAALDFDVQNLDSQAQETSVNKGPQQQ